jgi:hypothetical protein
MSIRHRSARALNCHLLSRSAESVPPKLRGLRGRGGERPFSKGESARSAADSLEQGRR